ncbi:MAG: hypothetical protein E5X72_01710 [Mesorhizobium sp.]|uniref:hypothetical protein n=1 Tax=Mesorhizobium sp. TaxID=1871066 RepID=UPI0011FE445F|nr:hypothetical protein [Mesorhizobium sp.]TIP06459.1 MAG: hypothetical protein E5X72_01710 [Mesorhizobium sp.]
MSSEQSTAEKFREKILVIVADRRAAAASSPYDWKVCVGAIEAADREFRQIAVDGSAHEYGIAVISRLERFRDEYYDPDGEYTSGRSDIGSLIEKVRDALTLFA